jgi:hypothetical protein
MWFKRLKSSNTSKTILHKIFKEGLSYKNGGTLDDKVETENYVGQNTCDIDINLQMMLHKV